MGVPIPHRHIPALRLFLFNSSTTPSTQCHNLTLPHSLLLTWTTTSAVDAVVVSLRVPMLRVSLDDESPFSFKAFDDHIEVKLALLLPVGHSIVLNFDSILSLGEMRLDEDEENGSKQSKPLFMDFACTYVELVQIGLSRMLIQGWDFIAGMRNAALQGFHSSRIPLNSKRCLF